MSANHPEYSGTTNHNTSHDREQFPQTLAHDEEFWFDDGSIILVAGDTAFKIYKGLLAAQSPIFADLFAVAAPHPDQMFDGCPVVHLSDSVADLKHFLRALIAKTHRNVYNRPDTKIHTFKQLSSLVRLAHKYQIHDVQDQALTALQTHFASTFSSWDSIAVIEGDVRWGIEVIHLARLTDTPAMLPIAFYECAQAGGSIVEGWRREDGTVEYLSPDDLRRMIDGHAALWRRFEPTLDRVFETRSSPECASSITCNLRLGAMSADRGEAENGLNRPALLHCWANIIDEWSETYGFCEACSDMLLKKMNVERYKLWRELPRLFGLSIDGWGSSP